jgi:endonuclease YncB( thermonuclease family)
MPTRTLILVLVALVAGATGVVAGGILGGQDQRGGGAGQAVVGRVVKVVDGDTIHVQLGSRREKVRYIGIDTPVLWSHPVIPSTAARARRR